MSRTLPLHESLTVEFKSDEQGLSDAELIDVVVCLANTEGGTLYVGVEDDGRITGLHARHRSATGLAALIASRTVPPVSVRVTLVEEEGLPVACIEVPRSLRLVASSEGRLQRRRLKANGQPECVPFLPHEFATRESDLGLLDYSALPVREASVEDFDPLERQRLRQLIERLGGDRTLLGLEDAELDGALGLVRSRQGLRTPTVAGLLLLGREGALREHVPTHEVAFQVLDETEVKVNEFFRLPLLRLFERVTEMFEARVNEQEIQVGLFRVPVPSVDRRAFREVLVNALTHRDYTRRGAVHVRWEREILSVSNPGGFVEGVTLDNLIVVEPRPRNPLLADIFKRVGLAERTGRGVDLIFKGLLRYGRPAPDYSRSDSHSVVVRLSCAEADLPFLSVVLEEEQRRGAPLPLDTLMVLALLRQERRVDTARVAAALQRDDASARAVLERLVEAGLVEAHGVKRGRTYVLGAALYRRLGRGSEYVRQAGFDALQHEQMVLKYAQTHGGIRRGEAAELCQLSEDQASRLLRKLVKEGRLIRDGRGKATTYRPPR
jgi:ATP-dependent DNA helicase RecG